jgi:integrase
MRHSTEYEWQLLSDSNVIALNDEADAVAIGAEIEAVVSMQETSLDKLRALFDQFEHELRETLCNVLSMHSEEFAKWHLAGERSKYQFGPDLSPPDSCIGFKRVTASASKFHLVQHSAVLASVIDAGLLPAHTVKGVTRQTMPRFDGALVDLCQSLPTGRQRDLFKYMVLERNLELDSALSLGQANVVDLASVVKILSDSTNAEEALQQLAKSLWVFDANQNRGFGAGKGLHYAPVWFLMYLAREGLALLPRLRNSENLLPRILKPLFWTFFVPQQSRALAADLMRKVAQRDVQYVWPVFREFALNTNFFQHARFSPDVPHLLHLKELYSGSKKSRLSDARANSAKQHGINILFRHYIGHFGKTFEDLGSTALYFGGSRRINRPDGREAFGWVTQPALRKNRLFAKLTGLTPPDRLPDYLIRWAEELRALLPLFEVKALGNKVHSLNHWLFYLALLGDEAPRHWEEIDRERHINSFGRTDSPTFVDFLRKNAMGARVNSYVGDLRQAWSLAATRDGFEGKLSCPIDLDFDRPADSTFKRSHATKRRALDMEVYNIILEELRRDDFAFARSLNLYDRRVTDPATHDQITVFWPAIPCIVENILIYGMRLSSALWLDSGEGDENWIDPRTLEARPNPLPSRITGRKSSFLRSCRIGAHSDDNVLGIYLAVNKTGPHEVPISEEHTVTHFQRMRDLQVLYNPRRKPIPASRDNLAKQYGKPGLFASVFPLYRDPDSRAAHPPTDEAIHYFWTALLTHCQPIVNAKLGRPESDPIYLVINGKSCWDIHSLRVTTISTLLDYDVDPCIVAELVGHKSVLMTYHYMDRSPRKVHRALMAAFERRRKELVSALKDATQKEDVTRILQDVLAETFSLRPDNVGVEALKSILFDRPSGRYEVLAHCICPGGDCRTGGRLYKNAYQPVWRPRACSECRYRVTGPAFLPGLVHRLNSLMVEIKFSLDEEADLNRQIEQCEADGASDIILRGLVSTAREQRDHLFAEWCAELQTIQNCLALERNRHDSSTPVPVLTGLTAAEWSVQSETVHQLTLMNAVLGDAQLITGAAFEVPMGLRERRDAILLEVARLNNLAPVLYNLPPDRRRRAFDAFGELLCAHASNDSVLQQLVDGTLKISELPALEDALQELAAMQAANDSSSEKVTSKALSRLLP